ncbi:cell division protein FtsB [Breznakibacter xylanolyticus]|uniref:Cell division protein FtsB n=1 Tax=Breznakibacter xylanolyticus TaxID=990 RepID=A0A2W7NJV2_9BACT|nr:septum formation initiator family protein [Breznakibacter xylanolyticus]MBN2742316.1 septum formation initiator family protein [Marinilabiliaceae bacterium]PZX20715.1 cell division protein FtsB [Breznakibacter xylanolyticus]
MWKRIWPVVKPLFRNKYFVTALVFLIWIGVFDQSNLWERFRMSRQIRFLEQQKKHYQDEIDQNNRKYEELRSNSENLEKFAREEYLMKRKNEVIFVVNEE